VVALNLLPLPFYSLHPYQRCSAFERSEKELVEENRRLEVKARAMTEEVATAMELVSDS
jgi:hypothetical protein